MNGSNRFSKLRVRSLAAVAGLGALILAVALLATAGPALAHDQQATAAAKLLPRAQPPPTFVVDINLADGPAVEIQDLSGNVVAVGTHTGVVRCNGDNCNRHTELAYSLAGPVEISYRFSSRLFLDPAARLLGVAGRGVLSTGGHGERFSFTAFFEDNGDGTVSATYNASIPAASFSIPRTSGTFEISSRP